MLETGKITSFQMALCIFPTVFSTAILTMPAINHEYAGRDMWLSPLFGSVVGFLTAWILCRLHQLYPGETIFEYSRHLIGRTAGKFLSGLYVLFFLYLSGFVVREYSNFIIISILPETPEIVIIGSFVLIITFAVSGGIMVLGKTAYVFVPIFSIPIPALLLLLAKDLHPIEILPILENGLMPPIKGASVPQAWFSEVFTITVLLPYLKDQKKALKWSSIAVLAIMVSMMIMDMTALFLFGELTGSYTFPIMKSVRYISLMNFFEHMDAAFISIWLVGAFIKIAVTFYTLTLGCAQWLNLKSYQPLVLPLGFMTVLFALWEFYNFQEQTDFTRTIIPLVLPLLFTVIPGALLIIAEIKQKRKLDVHPRKESP